MIVTFKFEFLLIDNTAADTTHPRAVVHCNERKVYLLLFFFYVVDAKRTGFEFGCQSGIDQPPTQCTQCHTPLLNNQAKERKKELLTTQLFGEQLVQK